MKLTLTNTAETPVPMMSEDDGGWVEALEPHTPFDLDRDDTDVAIIGDKPGALEAFKVMGAMVKALLTAWRGPQPDPKTAVNPMVVVTIENNGEKPVRVILGDPTNDPHVEPGDSLDAMAKGYIELRELGG
jgi:hypothetical protein